MNKPSRVAAHFLKLSFDYELAPANTNRVMAAMKEL